MLTKPKVLLVEDDSNLRECLEERLYKLNCECVAVIDGEKALNLLKNNAFTCVISDIRMSNIDGMDMLKAMRKKGIARQ